MCIQTGKTIDDPNRRRYPSDQFYLKSPEEMWEMFSYIPEALENTTKIAEQCNFNYEFHVSKLPKFPVPEGKEPFDYLKNQCYSGLIERYEIFNEFLNKPLNVEEFVDYYKENEEFSDDEAEFYNKEIENFENGNSTNVSEITLEELDERITLLEQEIKHEL